MRCRVEKTIDFDFPKPISGKWLCNKAAEQSLSRVDLNTGNAMGHQTSGERRYSDAYTRPEVLTHELFNNPPQRHKQFSLSQS